MADVKLTITDPDGDVIDRFIVFAGGKPKPRGEHGAGQDVYTDVDLSNNVRDYIDERFSITIVD